MRYWQTLTLKNVDFIAINIGSYWRCLRRKATESNLSSKTELETVVWRISCTEISEETNKREISEQLRKGRTNLRFLKAFAFQFLTSNFLYVYLFILNSGVPVTAYPAFIFIY